ATNALNSSCYKRRAPSCCSGPASLLVPEALSPLLFALLPCLFHGFLAQICEWVKGGHRRSGLDLGARRPDLVVILLAWSDGEVWERRGGEESAFRVCDGGASFSDLRTAALLLRLSLRKCVGGLSSPVVQSCGRGGCLCFSSKLGRCLRFVLGLCPWRLGEVHLPFPARKVIIGLILPMVAPPESGRFRVSPPSHPVSSVWTVGWCCLLTSSMALLTVPFMSTLSLLCSGTVLARAWIPISL
ncbi:unnamed protein product, partial [Brassica napus]